MAFITGPFQKEKSNGEIYLAAETPLKVKYKPAVQTRQVVYANNGNEIVVWYSVAIQPIDRNFPSQKLTPL